MLLATCYCCCLLLIYAHKQFLRLLADRRHNSAERVIRHICDSAGRQASKFMPSLAVADLSEV